MTGEDYNALDAAWRKSTKSNGSGSCVEAGQFNANVLVRDTTDEGCGLVLEFTSGAWRRAIKDVKAGNFLK